MVINQNQNSVSMEELFSEICECSSTCNLSDNIISSVSVISLYPSIDMDLFWYWICMKIICNSDMIFRNLDLYGEGLVLTLPGTNGYLSCNNWYVLILLVTKDIDHYLIVQKDPQWTLIQKDNTRPAAFRCTHQKYCRTHYRCQPLKHY